MKIFVSYSNDDISHVNSFSKVFNESNKKDLLFIASEKYSLEEYKKMTPGQDWRVEITNKIEQSDAAILFLSTQFFNSEEVIDFELPLILKKASENNNYNIFPILVNDFNSVNSSFTRLLSKKEFLNSEETSLASLRGSRYNLELQNISERISLNHNSNKKWHLKTRNIKKLFISSILLISSSFYFLLNGGIQIDKFQSSPNQESITSTTLTTTKTSTPYVNFNTLGIGDCVNLDFQGESLYEFSPINVSLSEPVSCDFKHDAEIIKKFTVSRINSNELIFPGVYFGFVSEENCFILPNEDDLCDGVFVNEIISNSPASKTSLQVGDVITSVNGISTDTLDKFINYLSYIPSNKKTAFTYIRQNPTGEFKIYDDVIIPEARIDTDGLTSIVKNSSNHCSGEASLFQSLDVDYIINHQNTEVGSVFRTAVSKPIFNEADIELDNFTVVCILFIAEGTISNLNSNPIEFSDLKVLNHTILFSQELYKEWGYFNLLDLYSSYNEFGTNAKNFFELVTGDCFDLSELNFNLNAESTNFVTFENCSAQYQDAQIIGVFTVTNEELINKEIFISSTEFVNYIDEKCTDIAFNIYKDEIWKGLTSRYIDDAGKIIKGEFIRPLWAKVDDEISVKCSFSYSIGKGFERFRNVFDDKPARSDIVELSYSYCPKYVYTGSSYTINQNTIPIDNVNGLSFIIPSWNIGIYPIEKFVLYTNNENVNFIGMDQLGLTLDPLDVDRYLFEGNKGVVPFMFEILNGYQGEVTFIVQADDVGGGNAWAECTTYVINNASSNEILEISEFGLVSNNSWDSELSFQISTEQKLEDLDLPLIQSITYSNEVEKKSIIIELTKPINKNSIKNLAVKYVICQKNVEVNCVDSHDTEINFYEYSYRKFNLLNESEVLKTLEIPLYFYSCKNEYSFEIDEECLNDKSDVFGILEYIYIDLGDPYSCNIAYKGFTKNEEYLRDTNPENTHIKFYKDILYGENQSNTDNSKYSESLCESLESSLLPFTKDGLLFNYHYFPNFDFSSIFKGQLYAGTPILEIKSNR